MKLCPVCQEEFADKFSFCPVDGTPLGGAAAKSVEISKPEPISTAAAPPPASPVQETAVTQVVSAPFTSHASEYHLTIIEDRSITSRLLEELREISHQYQLTWPEFKRDPLGFVKRSVAAYGLMLKRFFARPNVAIAMLAAILSMGLIVVAVAWLDRPQAAEGASRAPIIIFTSVALIALAAILAGW